MSAFEDIAALREACWQHGFRVLAVLSHTHPDPALAGKAPLGKKWQLGARDDPPEVIRIGSVVAHATNTGILCDGLRAVDIDVDDELVADAVRVLALGMLGETIGRYRDNSKRCCLLYRAAEGEPTKRSVKGRLGKVEVLGKGQQFVAHGTHYSGAELYWYPAPPESLARDALTAVSEEQVTAFLAEVAKLIEAEAPEDKAKPKPAKAGNGLDHDANGAVDIGMLAGALFFIAGWDDYDRWIDVGIALHHATGGSGTGLDLWHQWSRFSSKYDAGACDKKWDTFATNTGRTVGSIFHWAKESGWERPYIEPERVAKVRTVKAKVEVKEKPEAPPVEPVGPVEENGEKPPPPDDPPPRDDDEPGDIEPPQYSENTVSRIFSDANHETVKRVLEWNMWYRWQPPIWRRDYDVRVFDAIRAIVSALGDQAERIEQSGRSMSRGMNSNRFVAGAANMAAKHWRHSLSHSAFNRDLLLLNTPGGVVDLSTGTMRPAGAADYMTCLTTVTPADTDECPTFIRVGLEIFQNNTELWDYWQRVCGLCLSGITRDHKLFFLHGSGFNGKSTLAKVLLDILAVGDTGYAKVAEMDTFVETRHPQHSTNLAMLHSARLVQASETDEGRSWALAKVKALTGEDMITAHFMAKDNFTYQPRFKLMVLSNHKPQLRSIDTAIKERLQLIPFLRFFKEHERDRDMDAKLKAEHAGILRWMINGFLRYQQIGLDPPDIVRSATESYMLEEDTFEQFLKEECETYANAYDTLHNLYERWKWWNERLGQWVGTGKQFTSRVRALPGVREHRQSGTGRMGWYGIKLSNQPNPTSP